MSFLNKTCIMVNKWLAWAAVFVLLPSDPGSFHGQIMAQGPLPIFMCFIDCGVKTVQCTLGCLVNPICYTNCGLGNLRCINYCSEALIAEEDQIPPISYPKTKAAGTRLVTLEAVARMIASAGIAEDGKKGSVEEMAKIIASAYTSETGLKGSLEAMAKITSSARIAKKGVKGSFHFFQHSTGKSTSIRGRISELSPGTHGLSIHSAGDCSSTGPHFNPFNRDHGAPWNEDHHIIDLGTIVAGLDGIAEVSIKGETIQLVGANSVLDRAIVAHADTDDLRSAHEFSKMTETGAALDCGIIEIESSF